MLSNHASLYTESEFERYSDTYYFDKKKKPETKEPYCFYEQETVGGVSGGSCWDSSDPQPFSRDEGYEDCKKQFDKVFDAVLLELCPSISFLQYKNVYNECVSNKNKSVGEYYGNSNEYFILYCRIKDLYEKLKDMDLI